jgi:hypothetical protein
MPGRGGCNRDESGAALSPRLFDPGWQLRIQGLILTPRNEAQPAEVSPP